MTLFNLGDTSYAHETMETSYICHMFNMQIQNKIIIQALFNGDFSKKKKFPAPGFEPRTLRRMSTA